MPVIRFAWRPRQSAHDDHGRARVAPASRRASLTLVDQGVASISNFAVTVAIARLSGAEGLGVFAIAYASWGMVAAFHRALVTDPMTIHGDARNSNAAGEVRRGLAAELLLGSCGMVLVAMGGGLMLLIGQRSYGDAMLVLAAVLPFLLLQDFWRWIGFMSRRPRRALANDVVFAGVQAAAFAVVFLVHLRPIGFILAAWGAGAAAGALYGLLQYRVGFPRPGDWSLLADRWHLSKWLAGDTLVGSVSRQMYIFISGAILGPVGLGGLQAATSLVTGPSMVLIQAAGSVGLPEASYAFEKRGWRGLLRVSWMVTALGAIATGAFTAVVAIWGSSLLSLVYGPSFAHLYVVALLIAFSILVTSAEVGPLMVLKTTRNTRWILHVKVVVLFVMLTSVTVLSLVAGVPGAAAASLVVALTFTIGSRWYQYRAGLSDSSAGPILTTTTAGDGLSVDTA